MTCKKCIHYDVCGKPAILKETMCKEFKDKAKFIELPCKVGGTVYEPFVCCDYPANPMQKCYIEGECQKCEYYRTKIIKRKFSIANYDTIKNKIWFLTREEAEKALKEREKNV